MEAAHVNSDALRVATLDETNRINLTFSNLNYSIPNGFCRAGSKTIFSDISGDFRSGELTAIIGQSGAGKSKLMDILAGFTTSNVKGTIRVNDVKRNLVCSRRSSCYVMENDSPQPLLTVLESMTIAAQLKLRKSHKEIQRHIGKILQEIGLEEAWNTRTDRLSCTDKRKLSIALELISSPPVMFFDGTLNDLDHKSSKQCLHIFKALAREGRTIVFTINQPSATTLDLIDHLYVIESGTCIYTGGPKKLIPFLESLELNCPINHNPADFILEVTIGDAELISKLRVASSNGANNSWRHASRQLTSSELELAPKVPIFNLLSYSYMLRASAPHLTSFSSQMYALLKRNKIKLCRDKKFLCLRVMLHFMIAFFTGLATPEIGRTADHSLENIRLQLFHIIALLVLAFSSTIVTYPLEVEIVKREHWNRWYKLHAFYLAYKLTDLPWQVTATTIYTITVYYLSSQLNDLYRFIPIHFTFILVSLIAQLVGIMVGVSFNFKGRVIFGTLLISALVASSDILLNWSYAHSKWQWLLYLSFIKYAFEATVIVNYGDSRVKQSCLEGEIFCPYKIPQHLLREFDLDSLDYESLMCVLIGFYVCFDLIAYCLLRLNLKKRNKI